MPRSRLPLAAAFLLAAAFVLAAATAAALEPPTSEQLERYRLDGSLASRVEAARAIGNHRMAPQLAARVHPGASAKALPDAPTVLPSAGSARVLTLLVAFADMPGTTDPAEVDGMLYGDGNPDLFPYESLAAFYRRASYGQLEITGSTLGWYTTAYPRDEVPESTTGREALIREVITHYDDEGHDFAQYDNDGDGVIDYLVVVWTGPHGEWAEFWWGYQTSFRNSSFTVDGVRLGTYSWQWENYDWPGPFSPSVVIHETGHALGLPDYYDYDDSVGPRGGVGGLDQMDGNWGDHNAFSKWVLGWLEPHVINEGADGVALSPTDGAPDAAVFMHGNPVADPYAEYFLAQVRRPSGNDAELPDTGVLIWHVDARLDDSGGFRYDNSYTEHKLLRLMEADGLEEIEQGGRADADDFYKRGDVFDTLSVPSSHRYDGVPTNVAIQDFSPSWAGPDWMLTYDLGSGCALWCDASVSQTAWPGIPVSCEGSLATANCEGAPSYGWVFGDGATSGETSASHAYVSAGSYTWDVTAQLGDAVCTHRGTVLVCTDPPCWQWTPLAAMTNGRAGHAAVELGDGTILVVGGNAPGSEIYDVTADVWSAGPDPVAISGETRGVSLADGRVLFVGQSNQGVSSEVYDPGSGSFSATAPLNHDRLYFGLAGLLNGRAVIAGGISRASGSWEAVPEVEVFDPDSSSWSVVGTIDGDLIEPAMVTLSDGRVLIVGGRAASVYDPTTGAVSRATPLPAEWAYPLAVELRDGRVLLSDIAATLVTLVWDPATGRLQIAGKPSSRRAISSATVLPSGLVLVAGGADGNNDRLASTEIFDPATLAWSAGSAMTIARVSHSATLSSGGRLLLIGGFSSAAAATVQSAEVEQLSQPASPPRHAAGRAVP